MAPLVITLLDCRLGGWIKCRQFGVVNGVKQDGVLSPLLFRVYIDGLFIRLDETSMGCQMDIHFSGALAFADDLNLLALILSGLSILIDVYDKYITTSICISIIMLSTIFM